MATPSESFIARVLEVVDSIPSGRVMTYGDVAAAIGSRAPRAVGQVMAYAGSDVAWWRVIRASGRLLEHHEIDALAAYRTEGTPLLQSSTDDSFRVDLRKARWFPPNT